MRTWSERKSPRGSGSSPGRVASWRISRRVMHERFSRSSISYPVAKLPGRALIAARLLVEPFAVVRYQARGEAVDTALQSNPIQPPSEMFLLLREHTELPVQAPARAIPAHLTRAHC